MDVDSIRSAVIKYIEAKKDGRVGINGINNLPIVKGQNPKLIGELYYFVSRHGGKSFTITDKKKFGDYFTDDDLVTIFYNLKEKSKEKSKQLSESTKSELLLTMFRYASILGYIVTEWGLSKSM